MTAIYIYIYALMLHHFIIIFDKKKYALNIILIGAIN